MVQEHACAVQVASIEMLYEFAGSFVLPPVLNLPVPPNMEDRQVSRCLR